MKIISKIITFLIISFVTLYPLVQPFTIPGKMWTYDVDIHQFRMAAFHKAVMEGNIPPKWSTRLVYGWGSPVYSFNWSLPYWMGEPFLIAGWNLTDAQKAVIVSSVLLSYITMFVFLFTWFGFWPALAGAVTYEWSLFHIYLLFTGGGLGMHTTFIFWPVLFLGALLVIRRPMLSFFFILIGTAGAIESHQVMFLMIQPLFWSFVLLMLWKERMISRLPHVVFSFLTGLGLTAFFWLPAFHERQFLHMNITESIVKDNFLNLKTIIHQPGITFTIEPPLQYWYWSTGWNVFVICLLAAMIYLLLRKKTQTDTKRRFFPELFIFFLVIGQLFMTVLTSKLWEIIPLLSTFQYPVRFQTLSLFCASILLAWIILKSKKWGWMVALIAIVTTVGINIMAIPHNWPRTYESDEYFYESNVTSDMMGEYLPVWAKINHFFNDSTRYTRYPVARIIEGTGTVSDMVKGESKLRFTVHAESSVSVVINQFYFPGWSITENGKEIPYISYGVGEMRIQLPKGIHTIEARFTDTPIRTAGNWITMLTGVIILVYFWNELRKRNRQK